MYLFNKISIIILILILIPCTALTIDIEMIFVSQEKARKLSGFKGPIDDAYIIDNTITIISGKNVIAKNIDGIINSDRQYNDIYYKYEGIITEKPPTIDDDFSHRYDDYWMYDGDYPFPDIPKAINATTNYLQTGCSKYYDVAQSWDNPENKTDYFLCWAYNEGLNGHYYPAIESLRTVLEIEHMDTNLISGIHEKMCTYYELMLDALTDEEQTKFNFIIITVERTLNKHNIQCY